MRRYFCPWHSWIARQTPTLKAAGSNPVGQAKSGPVIDTMCRLSVRFILSRKALQIGRFCKIAGAFEAPSEGENEPLFSFMDLL